MLSRRQLLLTLGALASPGAPGTTVFPTVTPRVFSFPEDFGAHPDFRTEWWYLTGWLGPPRQPLGFQVTFFRVTTDFARHNPSAFAARELVIAHGALAIPSRGNLLVDQRIARTGFGRVAARTGDTRVVLDGWSLEREPATDTYVCRIGARDFTLHFRARATGAPWLQGNGGVSQKGPKPGQASYYYSRPGLGVTAELTLKGAKPQTLRGTAWLDHEWSSAALAADAAGWDWVGMQLDDGRALLAFQIRRQGGAPDAPPLQRYAAFRRPNGDLEPVAPETVHFTPLRQWTSTRSRGTWPVAQRLTVGGRTFESVPLMEDQELDSRLTTGAVYWEGASTLLEAGRPVGRGYLEMTGYQSPLRL